MFFVHGPITPHAYAHTLASPLPAHARAKSRGFLCHGVDWTVAVSRLAHAMPDKPIPHTQTLIRTHETKHTIRRNPTTHGNSSSRKTQRAPALACSSPSQKHTSAQERSILIGRRHLACVSVDSWSHSSYYTMHQRTVIVTSWASGRRLPMSERAVAGNAHSSVVNLFGRGCQNPTGWTLTQKVLAVAQGTCKRCCARL